MRTTKQCQEKLYEIEKELKRLKEGAVYDEYRLLLERRRRAYTYELHRIEREG